MIEIVLIIVVFGKLIYLGYKVFGKGKLGFDQKLVVDQINRSLAEENENDKTENENLKKLKKTVDKKQGGKRMKKVSLILIIALVIALIPLSGLAQFKPESGQIKGYMAADYYWSLNHHTGEIDDEGFKGRHGFWFRRIYFTYDNKLSDTVKMRLRFEMNSPGDFNTKSTLDAFVKDAYLDLKLGGGASVRAGIQGPPSFAIEEDIWGWRPLEKTPLDLYKWTSSRDFGVAIKGGKTLVYHFMFGQGSSNKAETDSGKKFFGSLAFKRDGFVAEAMAQYERAKIGDDDIILKGFGAYSGDWGRVGVMYAYRDYKKEAEDSSLSYNIFSTFAVIKAGKKVELIGRYDMNFGDGYKTSYKGSKVSYVPFADNVEFSFVIAALSYEVHKNVWLIPNVKFAMYKDPDEGDKPDGDFYGNLTLWFKF